MGKGYKGVNPKGGKGGKGGKAAPPAKGGKGAPPAGGEEEEDTREIDFEWMALPPQLVNPPPKRGSAAYAAAKAAAANALPSGSSPVCTYRIRHMRTSTSIHSRRLSMFFGLQHGGSLTAVAAFVLTAMNCSHEGRERGRS